MTKYEIISELLDTLYTELTNEISIHCDGMLDEHSEMLASALMNAIQSTRTKLCGSIEEES